MNICDDNRFEIIEKAKEALLDSTNIEQSPDEMKALDNFLFRCWQMGWLNKYESKKNDSWIPCSERLPEEDYDTVLVFLESNIYDIAIWHNEFGFRPWYAGYFEEATPEWESKVVAWMPLPEPFKAGDQE